MAEELHTHDDLPISAGMGWMQMEALLNKTLPLRQKPSVARLLMACIPALLMLCIFLFSSLNLGNQFIYLVTTTQQSAPKNAAELYTNTQQDLSSTVGVTPPSVKQRPFLDVTKLVVSKLKPGSLDEYTDNIISMEKISYAYLDKTIAVVKDGITIHPTAPQAITMDLNLSNNTDQEKIPTNQWELSAGIAANIATGKDQNLQAYPVAEVRYNINPRFFIAAGLSLLSPKQGDLSGVSKTVYVNDTPSNIKLYNSVISYDKLKYADVPVTAGMNIGKKLSLQAGLQVSVLVSKRRSEYLQPYDFQMNNLDMQYTYPLMGMAANPEQDFKLSTPTIDYRFISAVKYKLSKSISTGLSYQYNLPGNRTWKNNTSKGLFSLNVMYKIK
jgi:hypothetical protein